MKDKISFNTIDTSTTGVKTVTYTGVDSAGNKSEVQLQVEVTFSGERIVNTGLSKKDVHMYGDQQALIHSIVQDLHNGYIDKMVFIFQELHQNKKLLLKSSKFI